MPQNLIGNSKRATSFLFRRRTKRHFISSKSGGKAQNGVRWRYISIKSHLGGDRSRSWSWSTILPSRSQL